MESNGDFSPDGKLVAYQSNESGENEVYVQSFPNVGGKRWKVSSDGGTRPEWARNGQELFFFSLTGALTSLPIQRQGSAFTVGMPRTILTTPYYSVNGMGGRTYDVSADGQHFLMMKPVKPAGLGVLNGRIEVVLNWFEELKRIGPP
jgi:hypothetical protein